MSVTSPTMVDICKSWYKAFDSRNIQELMSLFTAEPLVVVGAGGSSHMVPYHGIFKGYDAVHRYYAGRFAQTNQPNVALNSKIRPDCAFVQAPFVFSPWVVFSGSIADHPELSPSPYRGPFLHVFRFGSGSEALKIAALEMFIDPAISTHAASSLASASAT